MNNLPRIYTLDVSQFEDEEKYCISYEKLPHWRQKKVDSFLFAKDRHLSLGAGTILLKAFEDYGFNLFHADISTNSFGKPYCTNKNIYFNLSHSGNLACGIFSDCAQVGIDIELMQQTTLFEEFYDFLFHEEEKILLERLDNLQQKEKLLIFYRIWTMKEAYLKKFGKGLSIKPSSILLPEKFYQKNLKANLLIQEFSFCTVLQDNCFFAYSLSKFDYALSFCCESKL